MEYKTLIIELQNKLFQKLSPSRYQHSLGVAYTAGCLSMKYDIEMDKAIVAGLLHDCAKYMDGGEMLKKALKFNLEVTDAEKTKPDLLHAKLGEYYAKNKYNVDDTDILSSIRYHTTGRPAMTLFEKIIYISDYIEPGRDKMPRLDIIRKAAFEDIDECLKMILEDTVSYLENSGMNLDKTTIDTYEYYCK